MKNLLALVLLFAPALSFANGGVGVSVSQDYLGTTSYVMTSDHVGLLFDYKRATDLWATGGGSALPGSTSFTRWEVWNVGVVGAFDVANFKLLPGVALGQATKHTLARAQTGYAATKSAETMENVNVSLLSAFKFGGLFGLTYDTAPNSISLVAGWHF